MCVCVYIYNLALCWICTRDRINVNKEYREYIYHLFAVKGRPYILWVDLDESCKLEMFEKYAFKSYILYDVVLPLRRLTFRRRVCACVYVRCFSSFLYIYTTRRVFSIQHNTVSARIWAHLAVNLVARDIFSDSASYTKQ